MDFITDIKYVDIPTSKINQKTCDHFGVGFTVINGDKARVISYKKSTVTVFQTVDFQDPSKNFTIGDSCWRFLGQDKYNKGNTIVITEDYLNCMAVSQSLDIKYPCVALPKLRGEKDYKDFFELNSAYLSSFDTIVLFLNNNNPSRYLSNLVKDMFPYKAKSISYNSKYNDPLDLYLTEGAKAITNCYWSSSNLNEDCDDIYNFADITYDELTEVPAKGYDMPFKVLNEKMHGLRKGELTIFTAGSGIGKSTIVTEIGHKFNTVDELTLGNIYLEEDRKKTGQRFVSLHNDLGLGDLRADPEGIISKEKFTASMVELYSHGRMWGLNHFGSLDCDLLIKNLENLALAKGCDFIILDHISMVVSGLDSNDERKDIDKLMTSLRSFINRTGVGVIAIVHLKRPPNNGVSFNEGRQVSLSDLRGSAGLEQLSDNVIAAERNQQSATGKLYMTFRILKCREFGEATGEAGYARYVPDTGRILHSDTHPDHTAEGGMFGNGNAGADMAAGNEPINF